MGTPYTPPGKDPTGNPRPPAPAPEPALAELPVKEDSDDPENEDGEDTV
jgi:hypothetical protein